MAKAICPICGLEGEAGAYCEICGRASGRLSAEPASVNVNAQASEPASEARPVGAFDPEAPFTASVEYPETMWKGQSSPVLVRFRAQTDLYTDVTVAIANGNETLSVLSLGRRPGSLEHPFAFNIMPRMAGAAIHLTVRFLVLRDGAKEPDRFSAPLLVCVKEESLRPVQIQASNGGSILLYGPKTGSALDLSDHRFDMRTISRSLYPTLEASAVRLMLRAEDGEIIHLWAVASGALLRFGRQDTCDGVLRVFDAATGLPDRALSCALSRCQFSLLVEDGRRLVITDGGERPSAFGTAVGGVEVCSSGCVLRDGENAIVLAPRHPSGGVLALTATQTRSPDGRILGLRIVRRDARAERFVLLVGGEVRGERCALSWDGRRFLIDGRPVVPGANCRIAGRIYRVCTDCAVKE